MTKKGETKKISIVNIKDDYAELIINSTKFGIKIITIDLEDIEKCNSITWRVRQNVSNRNNFYIDGYIIDEYTGRRNKSITLHRYLLDYIGKLEIDHIDGNTLNNRKNNLRLASTSQNKQNQLKCQSNNKSSGIKNVYYRKDIGKYRVAIRINKKLIHIGHYNTKEEAEDIAKKARQEYHPFSQEALNED